MLSEKFCMGVRDPQCYSKSYVMGVKTRGVNPKSFVAQNKTQDEHIDFGLCDRSRG